MRIGKWRRKEIVFLTSDIDGKGMYLGVLNSSGKEVKKRKLKREKKEKMLVRYSKSNDLRISTKGLYIQKFYHHSEYAVSFSKREI